MFKTLIVDDDRGMRYILRRMKLWNEMGFELAGEACDGYEAIEKLRENRFDFVLTDIKMPGMDGIELIKVMYDEFPDVCVSILSTHSEFEYAKQGMRYGAFDYLVKPVENDDLKDLLKRVVLHLNEQYAMEKEQEHMSRIIEKKVDIFYPQEEVDELCDRILSGKSTVKSGEKLLLTVCNNTDHDFIKSKTILSKVMIHVHNKVTQEVPWLKMVYTKEKNLEKSKGQIELNSKFTNLLNIYESYFKKFELGNGDSLVRKICQWVVLHVEDDYTLEMISEEIGVSTDYLGKVFKKNTNMNLKNFIKLIKMERAKILISEEGLKTYEISERLGYSKPDYFSKLFKEYVGVTPTQYRKRC